jgi:hypothetical protein
MRSFAGTGDDGEVAPIPADRGIAVKLVTSTQAVFEQLSKYAFFSPFRSLRKVPRQGSQEGRPGWRNRLCQLSRLLIDYVSAILPRAQAVSRMPSAIAALRMCCQRRVAAGTRWRMRDLQRRKFRSSSWPRQYRLADPVLFNPSIGRHRPLMPR